MSTNLEILEVKTVNDALKLIYSHFWDPLYDDDENLSRWVEYLQDYCMNKDAQLVIINAMSEIPDIN